MPVDSVLGGGAGYATAVLGEASDSKLFPFPSFPLPLPTRPTLPAGYALACVGRRLDRQAGRQAGLSLHYLLSAECVCRVSDCGVLQRVRRVYVARSDTLR